MWETLVYGLFLLAILVGIVSCWRSRIPTAQKLFWSMMIVVFPIAGTIVFWLTADDSKESFS